MINPDEVNKKLEDLRVKWIANPEKRPTYEAQAKLLHHALDYYYKRHPQAILVLDNRTQDVV